MRVAIVRRELNTSFSMDVYADSLVRGLKAIRPDWEIIELYPQAIHQTDRNAIVKRLRNYYEHYWCYPRKAREKAVDIFHVVDHSDGHLVYTLKKSAVPVVVTCHDLINLFQPENAKHQALLPWLSSALWRYSIQGLKHAHHVVAVSKHTAMDVQSALDIHTDRLSVVYNAVETVYRTLSPEEYSSIYQQYSIPQNRFCFLNVGSNQPRKNVTTILKVLKNLVTESFTGQERPSVHFIKAGADFTEQQKVFIKQYNLSSYITHIEYPDKATLVQLYNLADVLVAPSLYEGFGITILEAMACGTPVITSNVSSLPEIVGSAGILVNPHDIEEITEALHNLQLKTDLRQTLERQGLSHVKEFTWERSAANVARVYEMLYQDCVKG